MPNWNTLYCKLIKGSKSVVCAREGWGKGNIFLAAYFAKRNTEFGGGGKAPVVEHFVFTTGQARAAPEVQMLRI